MSNPMELDSYFRDRTNYPNPCEYKLNASEVSGWFRKSRTVRATAQNPANSPLDFIKTVNVNSLTLPYPRVELYTPIATIVTTIGNPVANTLYATNTFVNGNTIQVRFPQSGLTYGIVYYVINATPNDFQVSLTPGGAAVVLTAETLISLPVYLVTPEIVTTLNNARELVRAPRVYLDFHCSFYNDRNLVTTINSVHPTARFAFVQDRIQFDEELVPVWIHYKSLMEQTLRVQLDDTIEIRIFGRNDTTIPYFVDDLSGISPDPYKQTIIDLVITPFIRSAEFDNHNIEPALI